MIIAQELLIVLLIVPLILAFFAGVWCAWDDFDNKILIAVTIVLVVFGLFSIGVGISAYASGDKEYYDVEGDSVYLYALGSGSGVHGTFLLGTGSIDDTQYYIGYTNIRNNEYKQIKFDASKSKLILDDSETPRAVPVLRKMKEKTFLPDVIVDSPIQYGFDIYIPTDGIKQVYAVN